MTMENTVDTKLQAATRRNKIHPLKLALWVAIASLVMMFTALTSAYIVRQAAGNWLEFDIPNVFYWSTLTILVSSLTLHASYLAFKRQAKTAYQYLLVLTFLLGAAFLYLQYLGWHELSAIGVPLKTNPSGDFVYAISGLHGLHILGGLGILLVSMLVAFLRPFKITPVRKLRFELVLTYWHFVDLLWLYLIVFMSLYR